jgi:hypothetical protein
MYDHDHVNRGPRPFGGCKIGGKYPDYQCYAAFSAYVNKSNALGALLHCESQSVQVPAGVLFISSKAAHLLLPALLH